MNTRSCVYCKQELEPTKWESVNICVDCLPGDIIEEEPFNLNQLYREENSRGTL